MIRTFIVIISLITFNNIVCAQMPASLTGPRALVYKTRHNYSQLVPVQLSADKKKIVSYPDPTDIKTDQGFTTPTSLHNAYWLDNRGIGKNTAFLKISYKNYALLKTPPSLQKMQAWILDKNPMSELYDCGDKNILKDPAMEMNILIDKNELRKKCNTIK
ncbi:MAG: hypothetical protein WCG87_01850 [Bacteroidota bacterium]